MLGKIVVNDKGVFSLVAEIFSYGASRKRSQVPERSRIRGGCRHHAGIVHGAPAFQVANELCHLGSFLPDGHINANWPRLCGHIELVENDILHKGGFSDLPVSDDKFALAAAYGARCVYDLNPCGQ